VVSFRVEIAWASSGAPSTGSGSVEFTHLACQEMPRPRYMARKALITWWYGSTRIFPPDNFFYDIPVCLVRVAAGCLVCR